MRQRHTILRLIGSLVVCLMVLNVVPGTSPQIARSQASPRFTITPLNSPAPDVTKIYAINDAGQMAGDYQAPDGHVHAFFWNGTNFIDINCPTCSQSHAEAINALGQITGSALGISGLAPVWWTPYR